MSASRDSWTKAWPDAHWETVFAREMRLTEERKVMAITRDADGTLHTRVLDGAWGFNVLT